MIWQILVSVAAWLALMFLSTNLLGFFVRNAVSKSTAVRETEDQFRGAPNADKASVVALMLLLIFLASLAYFGNYALSIAACMLLISRLPDLVFEMREGRSVTKNDMMRTAFPIISTLLAWASLPVIWYGLYRL